MATAYQKAFIFGSWVPWRVHFSSISSGPRVYAWGGGGAGVKNWDSLTKCYTCTSPSFMLSKDIRTDISHPFDIHFHEMKVRVV